MKATIITPQEYEEEAGDRTTDAIRRVLQDVVHHEGAFVARFEPDENSWTSLDILRTKVHTEIRQACMGNIRLDSAFTKNKQCVLYAIFDKSNKKEAKP